MASTTTQYTQANRPMSLSTPLGDDVLLLVKMTYAEEISRPFLLSLEMQSTEGEIDFNKILGQSVTVTIQMPDQSSRYLNGIVRKFVQTVFKSENGLYGYRAEVVPAFAMLDLSSTCACYEFESVPAIISQVFSSVNFSDYELNLTMEYPPLRSSIQYCESPFAYVSRLMESAGIKYHFEHTDGSHSMVLYDSRAAIKPFQGSARVQFNASAAHGEDCITEWSLEGEVQPGAFAMTDYDYTSPATNLFSTSFAPQSYPWGDAQRFEYPVGHYTPSDVQRAAEIRLNALQCKQSVRRGAGPLLGISAGYDFTLVGFPRQDQNIDYLVTSAELRIATPPFDTVSETDVDFDYHTGFTVIPKTVIFSPECRTPKPRIPGIQTAVVVAPDGQDTKTPYVSPYGSIKVLFRWDQNGPNNGNSSIWIRVSQISAGKGWGSMFIPRPGNEVLVAFEDGDPDRPIVVGCVYNAMSMPPIQLPANNLVSYITDDGGNVFIMNPTSGNESVHFYSPYNKSRHTVGASYM